ncbi:dipeptide ABC transporter glycylmethionine-binding lipoprotein [Mammaliicoccus stepanovicii]|uniref:Lipoprotein n=1 Tax=Mammaliicoccus stepanovicii TaxID=643214 RepID=A0A239YIX9_9STAP|nr:dipeptide ABC transporter glycylmethionine-binding lipoprotein [Mammaliicoccus stepanovicii]PNZ74677.1 methionine ABC transporter substrate-binding protein [Mammaliicoccus stepanovicii]GGI40871.1 lipoprotein [Mammaliicoccus stepanovicii]SNV58376.1 putative lipoprotein [Mammaliicoccus stepanovicii]
MKKLITLLAALVLLLAACGDKKDDKKVTVGIASNDTKVWDKVKELAKKDGIDVEIKQFSDYNVPNKALSDGDIDLNSFQHFAFLDQFEKANKGTDITPIRTTVFAPLGIYSKNLKDIKKLKEGAKVVIPNDVSNQARALKLLEKAGYIKLSKNFGLNGGPKDIIKNNKNLDIKAVDAQQTARALDEVDIAIINNGVASKAGLDPKKDPIYLEDEDAKAAKPYINFIAANTKDKDNKTYKKIADLYHSEDAKEALKEDTKDGEIVVDLKEQEIKEIQDSLK